MDVEEIEKKEKAKGSDKEEMPMEDKTKDTKDDKQFPYNINVNLDELEKHLNLY